MNTEFISLNEERNVSLTAYLQPVGGKLKNLLQRPAVLILPGGGYHVCVDSEADPVAYPYLNAGYHVFILLDVCPAPFFIRRRKKRRPSDSCGA